MIDSLYEDMLMRDKDRFADIINELLKVGFITERIYSRSQNKTVVNQDYRFIEVNEELFSNYLEMMNWDFIEDKIHGVFIARKQHDTGYIDFDKVTTIFVLILRILYEKKNEVASLESEVYVKLRDILYESDALGATNENPTNKSIEQALKFLRSKRVLEKIDGDYTDPDSYYLVYPSILHLVNSQTVENVLKQYQEYLDDKKYENYIHDADDNEELEEV